MKTVCSISLLCMIILACSHNKNLAQSKPSMSQNDTLITNINASQSDTEIINPKLKQLQQENDLVISFGTLNFAWARRGSFYVLAEQNNSWKIYRFDAKLPPSADDANMSISPQEVAASEAENIKSLYAKAQLWKTAGDGGENFCTGKKNCNINDAETWTLSVATKNNIHTTTYYAPDFFEECCPGNNYRKEFVQIAHAIMKMTMGVSGGAEK